MSVSAAQERALGKDSSIELVQTLAARIAQRGLTIPAIIGLELLKPFCFVGSQILLVLEPLLDPLIGELGRDYARLLEDRANVERLLEALESQPRDRSA